MRTGTFRWYLVSRPGCSLSLVLRRSTILLLVLLVSACTPGATPAPSGPAPTSAALSATDAPATLPPTPEPSASAPPLLVPADLDGVLTTPELAHRLPLFVSIDDSRAARPQAGFNAASVIWQAPADGYESRYLLVFQENDSASIGPVRSARIYLAQWAAEAHGALAHYGGDRMTRAWMTANNGTLFTNVDGMGSGLPAYHRIASRPAPHNAYTSTESLWRVADKLGAGDTYDPALHVRPFRDDAPIGERGAAQTIAIPYHTVKVAYVYDAEANAYRRSLDGKPHVDPVDKAQVTVRTVVVLFMPFRTDSTIEPGHNRPVLGFVGSGKAMVFMEGRVVEATWSKASLADPTLIVGPDGAELPLVRGRIMIQVVPLGTKVTIG